MMFALNLLLSIWCAQILWFAVHVAFPYITRHRPPDRETYRPR